MCGITAFFCRESVPDYNLILDPLFRATENRGHDGFGVSWINRKTKEIFTLKSCKRYSDNVDIYKEFLKDLNVGDLVLGISRAAPETESPSETKNSLNVQPIHDKEHDIVLVHNGAVSNKIYTELKDWVNSNSIEVPDTDEIDGPYRYTSNIDSEAILVSYIKHNYNIQHSQEYLSGGFAYLLYDMNKDCLFMVNDFKPIAQGYIRGYGYMLHSELAPINDIISKVTHCDRPGICLWENYYSSYLTGGRIKQVDLDSGFVQNIKYSPRYIVGDRWDSNSSLLKE